MGGFILYRSFDESDIVQNEQPPQNTASKPIMRVGEEYLYAADLEKEINAYPPEALGDIKKLLRDKMTRDSVILQAGAKAGLLTLSPKVYNSDTKDYSARVDAVKKIEAAYNAKQAKVAGSIVAIRFFSSTLPSEQAKTIAKQKIEPVYNEVKAGTITIQQAGERLKNDSTLQSVDPTYELNAYTEFNAAPNERITFDPKFNDMLRQKNKGEITELYLAQEVSYNELQRIDSMYMFAQVTDKQASSFTDDFEAWYQKQKEDYDVVTY